MYLLNATTFKLHYFAEPNIPEYAILSHRWGETEVSFAEIHSDKDVQNLPGFSKIRGCCSQALLDGWEHVWIDSCSIDKSNSVELSEAINSMFLWYSQAQVCYVYLSDLPGVITTGQSATDFDEMDSLSTNFDEAAFRRSKWFTRGWTLQELLAPQAVVFFTQKWDDIGTRSSLHSLLSQVTNIRDEILLGLASIKEASVAERMSWASERKTSRIEDIAYCLLGLFGVNMPPLYGEGRNAFVRLQLEIMKTNNDESIFAWTEDSIYTGSLLASSPDAFRYADRVRRAVFDKDRPPFQMTNKGLRMDALLYSVENCHRIHGLSKNERVIVLNCSRIRSRDYIALRLRPLHDGEEGDEYRRMESWNILEWNEFMGQCLGRRTIYVKQLDTVSDSDYSFDHCMVTLHVISQDSRIYIACNLGARTWYKDEFDTDRTGFKHMVVSRYRGITICAIMVHVREASSFLVIANLGKDTFGANIDISPQHVHHFTQDWLETPEADWPQDVSYNGLRAARRWCVYDRLSRLLESSASASLTLKKGASLVDSEGAIDHFEFQIYVDEAGRLPWPDRAGTASALRNALMDPFDDEKSASE